ncbi:MAG TPA: DNA-directed RNA polymerase subunit D [Candidatus Poseidoniales archaeon]|nr:MAG TPA: DNA-directed RNA polymerase subunit D [Candidatus Poseidoniales archaeon]HII62802.1 DNA-directed RNA polymerase subunit D [Candidatus Poseidoniaceae archaeon]|tara:strand:+ start:1914 stop:2828 length:915 start_codon:yes stop_codon:yes gene_type:complete
MKASVVDGWPKNNRIRIHITDANASEVNSIRRTILSDVPKMAITKVRFEQGTIEEDGKILESVNVLPDEMLAHRLAMIPIPTYLDEFLFPQDDPNNANKPEEEWGSPQSEIIYHCSIKGPSDSETVTVYAGDMNVLGETKLQIKEEHAKIPLTTLSTGQFLEFYAYASLGRGRDHAKWNPAAAVAFEPRMKAVLNDAKKAKVLFDLNLTSKSGKPIDSSLFKNKVCEDINDVIDLQKAMHQVGYGTGREDAFANAITLEEMAGEFVLTYESDGSLEPAEIFNQACKELAGRFNTIQEDIALAMK